ncbi:MAG: tripartite tricarboxylate transporter permease [Candidatus Aenigmatarchaeota archaeon]
MLNLLLYILLGFLLGVITGLIPGVHPNLLATLALSYLFFPPMESSVMLVAAGVTNTFVSFIPAVYLGAPSASTALSVLPGHELLLKGRGLEAIRLTAVGGIVSAVLVAISFPLFVMTIDSIYGFIEGYIHVALLLIIGFMVYKDRRFDSVVFFLLSGLLGYVVLEYNFIGTQHDLFPLLSGLFGVSILLNSVRRDPEIPPQNKSISYIGGRKALKEGTIGSIAGMVVGLLPGIGSAQATYVARELTGEEDERGFMLAIGGVNTSNIILSLLAVYLIGKGRSGIAVAVKNLMEAMTLNNAVMFVLVGLISAGLAAYTTIYLGKRSLGIFRKVNYRALCVGIIIFILLVSLVLTGIRGLSVTVIGSFLGLGAILSGCRRSYLMGSILFPVILFFLV